MRPRRDSTYLVLILALALALRLALVVFVPTRPISDFGAFDQIAINVVAGQGYVTEEGVPTAYRPPGYPLFLAGVYAVFGHSTLVARLINVLLGVTTCFLTYVLGKQLFDRRIGLLSALIVAGFPSHILHGNLLATENLVIPLLLGVLVTFLHGARHHGRAAWGWWILSGLFLGAAVLTRPVALLVAAVLGGVLLWRRVPPRRAALALVTMGGVAVLTIAPWTLRNARVLGEFVPVANEGGIALLQGHNERALQTEYSMEGPVWDELWAMSRSEAERDRNAVRLAFRFMRDNPGLELRLLVHHFVNFFKDDVSGVGWNVQSSLVPIPGWAELVLKGVAQAYYMAVTLLAIAAPFVARRFAPHRWYVVLYALFVAWTAAHLVFYGKDRFRLPLMPVYAVLAAVTLAALWAWYGRRFRQKSL